MLVTLVVAAGAWALGRFIALRRQANLPQVALVRRSEADLWTQAVEKVKADRGEAMGGAAVAETPTELRHYSDRHWFLATQVAEVRKFKVEPFQDFVDLAASIERGEMVGVPAVSENYVLFGVGAKADDTVFSRYIDDHNIALYDEAGLRDAYGRLETARQKLQSEISNLKTQLTALKKRERAKRAELQKTVTARQQELQANAQDKALLDRSYGRSESKQRLLKDYESLRALARNFGGRSYNLDNPADRYALKMNMLSSLRPQALKVFEDIARLYHDKFDRPLPVSSLVRPEQYQRALHRVNRNAVLIDTPPHSTGLAFDIDYRYMSAAEQNFVMTELARLKREGRIEVIRERNANYHVFAFIEGRRPADELITASLDGASVPGKETHHATKKPAKVASKSRTVRKTKARARNSRSKLSKRRR